jgi:signal transduction histidine kinase
MQRISSKTFITTGFSIIMVLLVVLMLLWSQSVGNHSERLHQVANEERKLELITAMQDAAYRRAIALHRMAEVNDPFQRDEELIRFRQLFVSFVDARDEFVSAGLTQEEQAAWNEARDMLKIGGPAQNKVALLLMDGKDQEASRILTQTVVPIQDQFMQTLDKLIEIQDGRVNSVLSAAKEENATTYKLIVMLLSTAILLAGFTTIIVRRTSGTEAALAEQGVRIRSLYEVSSQAGLSADAQMREMLKLGCNLLGMQIGKVCRIDEDNNENIFLNVFAPEGFDVAAGTVMPLNKTFCSITVTLDEPLAIHNVKKSKYYEKFSHLAGYIATAIYVRGERFGTVNFSSNVAREKPFTETDKDLVNLIGSWVSVALERQFAQQELSDAKEEAENANRTKSMFLASMSHELRTPLNAIIGYSELLKEEAEEDEQSHYFTDLKKISSSARHLLSLINDVLDLSKIEAGKMEIDCSEFDGMEVFEEVRETIEPLIQNNNNRFEIHCADNLGRMHTDERKLKQVLLNLLSNASKFTHNGTITFSAWRNQIEGSDWVFFEVKDTGIGITQEQMSRIFQAFSQAEVSTSSKYGGTGLGLPISRHMCRMMGGDIVVDGKYGQGSVFTVALPAFIQRNVMQQSA